MEIGFTPEQELLAETLRSLAERFGPRSTGDLQAVDRAAAWEAACTLGLPGLRIPEGAGGSGAAVTDAMIVVEVLAWVSLSHTSIVRMPAEVART